MSLNITEKFTALLTEVSSFGYNQHDIWERIDLFNRKTDMLIRKVFGDKSKYIEDLKGVHFSPRFITTNTTDRDREYVFNGGVKKAKNLLNVLIDDIGFDVSVNTPITEYKEKDLSKVFIVHGHDDLLKTEVARFIEKLGFTAIILHEQASAGDTIIEKIEAYSNVGFGIVLYTPCDIGAVITTASNLQPRARQNVVFEHGYLIGKLGRDKVCALVKDTVETPNDISGVVYVQIDSNQAWHVKLAKEMRAAGYSVDMNKL